MDGADPTGCRNRILLTEDLPTRSAVQAIHAARLAGLLPPRQTDGESDAEEDEPRSRFAPDAARQTIDLNITIRLCRRRPRLFRQHLRLNVGLRRQLDARLGIGGIHRAALGSSLGRMRSACIRASVVFQGIHVKK